MSSFYNQNHAFHLCTTVTAENLLIYEIHLSCISHVQVHHSRYQCMHITNKALLSDTLVSMEWQVGRGWVGGECSSMRIMGMFAGDLY